MEVLSGAYGFKACRMCGTVKYHTAFYLQQGGRSLGAYCKPCCVSRNNAAERIRKATNPERHKAVKSKSSINWQKRHPEKWAPINRRNGLKFKYGMTPQDYERMVAQQGDKCALCGSTDKGRGKNRGGNPHVYWHIDHCHRTGVVRGLLCLKCNTRIGAFEKLRDGVGLESVSAYLAKSLI